MARQRVQGPIETDPRADRSSVLDHPPGEAESDRLADLFHMDEEAMTVVNASMPPDLCSPTALYLAHDSCLLNGEVIQAGMGGAARLAVMHAQGLTKEPMTPEDIAENIDTILDVTDARVTDAGSMQA